MNDKSINPNESLEIIQQMIYKTQKNYSNDSFYFIFWGWLVLITALAHFVLLQWIPEKAGLVWSLMIVGGIVSTLYGAKQNKIQKVKTHLDTYIHYLWIALGLAMVVVLAMSPKLEMHTYPVIILLYGIGTFVSGGLLNFKPLIIGGCICFILSIIAFMVSFQIQLLLIASAMLVSYIIPGHLLKGKFKN